MHICVRNMSDYDYMAFVLIINIYAAIHILYMFCLLALSTSRDSTATEGHPVRWPSEVHCELHTGDVYMRICVYVAYVMRKMPIITGWQSSLPFFSPCVYRER